MVKRAQRSHKRTNILLHPNASASEKVKYNLCKNIARYERENNLTEKQSPMKEQINIDSSTQSDLHRLVADVVKQKGNLKPEEREILFYISEKEGAAFEGEIRNKFILPKTSLWRLIKRLEREDLIEVTKIGGQNLIKLKLSHK